MFDVPCRIWSAVDSLCFICDPAQGAAFFLAFRGHLGHLHVDAVSLLVSGSRVPGAILGLAHRDPELRSEVLAQLFRTVGPEGQAAPRQRRGAIHLRAALEHFGLARPRAKKPSDELSHLPAKCKSLFPQLLPPESYTVLGG